jgi:membrane dipeptidase
MNPSRRKFLATVAGTGGAMLLGPDRLRSAEIDPRVAQIVSSTIAVDMHSHIQMRFLRDPSDTRPDPELDIAGEMKRAGFSAVCQTYALDALGIQDVGNYPKYFLQTLAFEDRLLAQNHMGRALNFKDLQAAHDQKQPIIIQAVEGAEFIEGRLERIEEAYKRGLRILQPLHERDDAVSPLGDVYTAPAPHLGGLTPFGAQVIKECNRLGMLVDITHGTQETVLAALKVATKPMILSHTRLTPAPGTKGASADLARRLSSKELAREMAAAGGVIGVWWRLSVTMADYVAAIRDMVDVAGIDHVGIGTDTDLTSSYALPYTNKIWADENGGFFYAVVGEMLKQGFTPEEIGKIGGGNFCRVFASMA